MTSGSTPAPRPDPDALRWRFGTSGGPGGQHAKRRRGEQKNLRRKPEPD